MATSDEPAPAGLVEVLSRSSWGSPPTFDVVRRSAAQPFWGNVPPHQPHATSNFDLNAPGDDDQLPANRGLSSFADHVGSGPVEESIGFVNTVKESEGGALLSFMDATGSSRKHHDSGESSTVRDVEPDHDTGPFVDYLSQFSGKKEVDGQEKERVKCVREVSEFPDELLSLSSSYHTKRGDAWQGSRPVADGAALFLATGRDQDGSQLSLPESLNVRASRAGPMSVKFGSVRLDETSNFGEVEKMSQGSESQLSVSIAERSLFPRNAVHIDRMDPFYSMANVLREERPLLVPSSSARETLVLSNNLAIKDEKSAMSRQIRIVAEPSKEGMSLSLKRTYEEMDAEVHKRRVEEDGLHTSLYSRQSDGRDGTEHSEVADVSHMRRRRERPGGDEQRFQNDQKRVQNDQTVNDDKSVVWPPIVVIENTRVGWDEERMKWKGLGIDDIRKSLHNVENLEYAKVKCLFDQSGQKSSALVIFPATFEGYFEAEALNERLERSGKGKNQWMKVRHQDLNPRSPRGFNSPDLVSPDGKRILYGYIAQPEDMQRADPHKNGLKWFIESFEEKVRKPAHQRHQDKELQRVIYFKLQEEALLQKQRLELDKNEVHELMQQFNKCTKKLELDKEREQAEQLKYEKDLGLRLKRNEEEKRSQEELFFCREQDIRNRLEDYKVSLQREREQKACEAHSIRQGINERIKQHEAQLAEDSQLEALQEMKLESQLRAEMERKLFELERKRQLEEKDMQDRQQEQFIELKLTNLKEKESLLQDATTQQNGLLKVMEDTVREACTLKLKLQDDDHGLECLVCLEEFDEEPGRQRAHYKDCNHANVCIGCAMNLWKQCKKQCPCCSTLAKQKPARLPAKIYF